jgi:hypothetical protein
LRSPESKETLQATLMMQARLARTNMYSHAGQILALQCVFGGSERHESMWIIHMIYYLKFFHQDTKEKKETRLKQKGLTKVTVDSIIPMDNRLQQQ